MSSHTRRLFADAVPYDPSCERTIHLGFLNADELALFSMLIRHRRSLPVYLGGYWRCYACLFECTDFAAMANHIMKTHQAAPFNDEDRLEDALSARGSSFGRTAARRSRAC
jgi:hypothetical protein